MTDSMKEREKQVMKLKYQSSHMTNKNPKQVQPARPAVQAPSGSEYNPSNVIERI